MKHVTDLTCCRALFAGWVFAYHVNLQCHYAPALGVFGAVVERGSLGVDGFFILSGMILAYSHPDLSPRFGPARGFWAKRLVRIYPVHLAMILALALMVGTAALFHVHPRQPGRFGARELLSHLALLQAWGASDRWAWNYPSWSISAEWAGYLLFPFLWATVRRQNRTGLAVILPLTLLGVIAAHVIARRDGLSLTYDGGLIRLFPEFIAGMAILPLLARAPQWLEGRKVALLGGLAVLAAAAAGSEDATIVALWVLLAGLLQAGLQGRPAVLGRVPAMRWLGELSYSYYMSFALVETVQATLWRRLGATPGQHQVIYIITTTALTFGVATLTWALVEQPALRAFAAYRRHRSRVRLGYAVRS